MHYAAVIENNNYLKSPTINIVPLTSVKSSTDISKIRSDLGNIFLGSELYRLLDTKIKSTASYLLQEVNSLEEVKVPSNDNSENSSIKRRLKACRSKLRMCFKMANEISKMKEGSIALVGQITTISKIRIYDPKNTNDVLGGIRLSNETMDKIDESIKQLFTKN